MTLYPGPNIPEGPTWFCTTADIPRGWNWRTHTHHEWKEHRPGVPPLSGQGWVQVRQVEPNGDDYVMTLQGNDRIPVTFDEISHVIDEATGQAHDVVHPIALAVWWLLVMGEVPGA